MSDPADSSVQNLLPVQAYFDTDGNFQTFIGQNKPFYATTNPDQSGLHITHSTIDSTTIGATTPSTGVFTNVSTTTGTVSTAPVGNTDITNKQYVDAVAQGLKAKQAVKCATTGDIVLLGLQTIDTYTTLAGDRVLVKNQTNTAENGIYIAASGAWTRSSDMDVWSEVPGSYTIALNGSTNLDTGWVCTAAETGTIGVTAMPWVQFSGSATYYAGTGLTLAANTFSITNTGVTAATKGSASKTVTATVNAQGQLTSLTDQDIAIAGTQITSGLVSPAYGGTGVNNGSNTLTWNASYTLDQSVASGAAPTFAGTNFSSIPNAALTNSSLTVNGTSISLGGSGTITAVNPNALTLGTGLSGTSYNGSAAVTAAIANTGVTASTYTLPTIAVNAQGQITSASNASTTGSGNVVLANGPTVSALNIDNSNPYIQFADGTAVTLAAGRMWYNGTTGSLNFGMGGGNITQQVGEEIFIYGKASAAITEGQLICKTGTVGASGVITFGPSPTGLTDNDGIIGIATENISSGSFGRITSFGVVHGITTTGASVGETWSNNDTLYYNPNYAGGMTNVKPSAPNIKFEVGTVINAGHGGSGSIQVLLQPGTQLGGTDSNVQITSVANNNLLQYDSGLGYWKNVASSSVSVGTATNLAGGGAGYIPYQSGSGATSFLSAGTTGQFLQSNGSGAPTWATPVSYASVTDDTTTNATRYPLFANQTSGSLSTEYTSSTKFQYNPSTGTLTASVFSGAGTSLTGTATSLSIGGNAATATSATTATNLAGGASGSMPYQTGSGTTSMLAKGSDGQILTLASGLPTWAAAPVTGVTITDDTTTNSDRYVTFTSATTGTITGENVSSTKLKYNPSTGVLNASAFVASAGLYSTSTYTATYTDGIVADYATGNGRISVGSTDTLTFYNGGVANTQLAQLDTKGNLQISGGIYVNSKTIAANYSIPSGSSGHSAGPITISSGVSVTVASGSKWVIL